MIDNTTQNVISSNNTFLINYYTNQPFNNADLYISGVLGIYETYKTAHEHIENAFPDKQKINMFTYEIFNHINSNPWTIALKNKRILILSFHSNLIREKISRRKDIYNGVDLFPECSIICVQTGNNSKENIYNICRYHSDTYDIVLLNAHEQNILANYIYDILHKPVIVIGEILPIYFGIIPRDFLNQRPDIEKLYVKDNPMWTII